VSGLGQSGYQVDPQTQDYDFTSDGRQIGCPTVKALVEHACSTLFNSSAVAGFGLQLPNGVKGDGFLAQVSARLTNCLSAMVAQGLIAIVSITVANMANPDGTFGLLTWRDLTAPPAGFNASTPSNEYRTPIG
jgi:hypothetical protein